MSCLLAGESTSGSTPWPDDCIAPEARSATTSGAMAPLAARYVVVLVCFFAAFTCYMDRVGFPLAYTVMAKVPPRTDPASV